MKVGELVKVKQVIGCHVPPQYRDRGIGIILKITKSKPIAFRGESFDVGDDITVHLGTGQVEVFCEESVKVV